MSLITTSVDSLRIYDNGIKTWVTENIFNLKVTPTPVPVVFATPEKVYGEMERLQGLGKKLRPILPFISITRVAVPRDASRYNISDIRGLAYVDESGSEVYSTKHPLPVSIKYQFDVWMNFQQDRNDIDRQFQLTFNHPVYVNFYFDDKIKDKICFFTLDDVADNSDLEPALQKNRMFRVSYNCTLNAWMYYGYFEQKTIGSYEIEVLSGEPEADYNDETPGTWTLEAILMGGEV